MLTPERPTHLLSAVPLRILGYLYIYYWTIRTQVRRFFERGSVAVLFLYLIVLGAEVLLEAFGSSWALHPHWGLRVVFFLVIALALLSKVREWSEHRQELYFIQAAKKVVEAFSRDFDGSSQDEAVEALLTIFIKNFEQKDAVNANLAQVRDSDGKLVVCHVYPRGAHYDGELALAPGDGGTGYCYAKGCVVYIPWTLFGHAVIQTISEDRPYSLVEDLFVPDNVQNFRSILSVPVSSMGKTYGVLNFDSRQINAFRVIDFQQAVFFGFVLAQLLHYFESRRSA